MNQQHNLDIFFRSVVGSLQGAVSYSISNNNTDGRILNCQKYIILKRQCLKSHFTYILKLYTLQFLVLKLEHLRFVCVSVLNI